MGKLEACIERLTTIAVAELRSANAGFDGTLVLACLLAPRRSDASDEHYAKVHSTSACSEDFEDWTPALQSLWSSLVVEPSPETPKTGEVPVEEEGVREDEDGKEKPNGQEMNLIPMTTTTTWRAAPALLNLLSTLPPGALRARTRCATTVLARTSKDAAHQLTLGNGVEAAVSLIQANELGPASRADTICGMVILRCLLQVEPRERTALSALAHDGLLPTLASTMVEHANFGGSATLDLLADLSDVAGGAASASIAACGDILRALAAILTSAAAAGEDGDRPSTPPQKEKAVRALANITKFNALEVSRIEGMVEAAVEALEVSGDSAAISNATQLTANLFESPHVEVVTKDSDSLWDKAARLLLAALDDSSPKDLEATMGVTRCIASLLNHEGGLAAISNRAEEACIVLCKLLAANSSPSSSAEAAEAISALLSTLALTSPEFLDIVDSAVLVKVLALSRKGMEEAWTSTMTYCSEMLEAKLRRSSRADRSKLKASLEGPLLALRNSGQLFHARLARLSALVGSTNTSAAATPVHSTSTAASIAAALGSL